MDSTILSAILGGIIGSLLTTLVQGYLSSRAERSRVRLQEKREAYIGQLNSLHEAAIRPSDASAKGYALWQTRVELVGSPEVCLWAKTLPETNENREERNRAMDSLLSAMRKDLDVDTREIRNLG